MKKNQLNICYSSDEKYAEQLSVSITSILKNSADNEFFGFYILNSDITDETKEKILSLKKIKDFDIDFIEINEKDFNECKLLNKTDKEMSHYHVTLPTYFRYKVGSIFKDISKILYLDCDTITKKPLSPLFNTNLKDKYCAMVLDAESKQEAKRLGLKKYFNAGMMLINLDLWRNDNLEEKLFEYTKNNKESILWQDQDVINVICSNKIKEIDNEWNFQFFLYNFSSDSEIYKQLNNVSILHLAGRFKPWVEAFEHPIFEEYFYYLKSTPWTNRINDYRYICYKKYIDLNKKIIVSPVDILKQELQPIYSIIDNLYNFAKQEIINQDRITDTKIDKVYNEISKNYDFTKDEILKNSNIIEQHSNEITKNTDIQIGRVYDEISKNADEITKNTDIQIGRVYDEISKNADEITKNTNVQIDKVYDKIAQNSDEITKNTDIQIGRVYDEISKKSDEITKNTNIQIDKVYDKITQNSDEITKNTDIQIGRVYDEISKNYDFTRNEIAKNSDEIEKNTGIEIGKVYDEISKNYDFTRNEILKNSDEITKNTDIQIGKVYDKIAQNSDEIAKNTNIQIDKVYDKISQNSDEITKNTNIQINKVYDEISQNTDEKLELVYDKINQNNDYTQNEIKKNINEAKNLIIEDTGKILDLKAKETDKKIKTIACELSNIFETNKTKIQNEQNKIKQNLEENNDYTKEQALKNYNELLASLKENNQNLFRLVNSYYEKQNKFLVDTIKSAKEEIEENIILPQIESIKQKVVEELQEFKNTELERIKELSSSEINNVKYSFDEQLNKIRLENKQQKIAIQQDYEKQILNIEMKNKELTKILKPVISIMKKFKKK